MDGKQLTDPVYSQCDLVYVNVSHSYIKMHLISGKLESAIGSKTRDV